MTNILKGKVSVPEGVLVRELAGESVLLDLNSESYFGLDEVGTRMWAVLTEPSSMESAVEKLLAEFDVEPQRLCADLHQLVEKLTELGLLHVHVD